MKRELIKVVRQRRRVRRVRKKISGSPQRPRLAVSRSHRNIEAQVIDDTEGRTLCGISTRSRDVRGQITYGGNIKAAAALGKLIGAKARALGIETVVFDRRGQRYHGRVKALADAAREAGLRF